jgi:hypothetical protein
LDWALERVSPRARAVFLRTPIADRFCPTMQDLDLVVFGTVDGFRPERLWAPDGTPIDLAWYPEPLLERPESLAQSGLAAHRFQCSQLLWDAAGDANQRRQAFEQCLYKPDIQANRIAVFQDIGYLTVREVGVTWDFPALALFWLQMGHAACVAAMADACRLACPNVFTRPFGSIEALDLAIVPGVRAQFVRTLRLDGDPLPLIAPLRRMHRLILARYARPEWPATMRQATRAEYEYAIAEAELEWRIGVARELIRHGHTEAAIHYLRFWAYSLARVPMVWNRASEGHDIAFLRPERPVLPDLQAHCPEIVPDLTAILGGPITVDCVCSAVDQLAQLRRTTLDLLITRGIAPHATKEWRPHRPPSTYLS